MAATKKKKKAAKRETPHPHPVRAALDEVLKAGEESALMADGFEDAIVGITLSQPGRPVLTVYDYEKCVRILVRRDKMTYEEAEEFLDFNTVGAWVGEGTPIFLRTTRNILTGHGLEDVLKKKKGKFKDPRQAELF